MKVVLATAGRFHMFALARELNKHRSLEHIFSGFPWSVLAREQIPKTKVTTFPYVRPFMMLPMRFGIALPERIDQLLHLELVRSLDWFVSRRLPACDVYVGHEGVGARAGKVAKAGGAFTFTIVDAVTAYFATRCCRKNMSFKEFHAFLRARKLWSLNWSSMSKLMRSSSRLSSCEDHF